MKTTRKNSKKYTFCS